MGEKLTYQRVVANFIWQVDTDVVFGYGDEDRPCYFWTTLDTWTDMGKPDRVTIGITPGDSLNG